MSQSSPNLGGHGRGHATNYGVCTHNPRAVGADNNSLTSGLGESAAVVTDRRHAIYDLGAVE